MISELKHKKVSISDFKAHCTEYIRALEKGDEIIEITRHGKIIAIASAPPFNEKTSLLGAGTETATLSSTYDAHAPAFNEDDWVMNQ